MRRCRTQGHGCPTDRDIVLIHDAARNDALGAAQSRYGQKCQRAKRQPVSQILTPD